MKVGIGYDVHKIVKNKKLVLGGEIIKSDFGLKGHSDADVLVHAVIDALLGASGLGDIGTLFPDTDDKYKDIYSIKLLVLVKEKLELHGYIINNIDSVIIAQKPKLFDYKKEMEKNIANALSIDTSLVNVKATTTEGLGFEGRKKGIAAKAIAAIE
ncbi:MAG: 2-C-methyl-D-erythritol 2,4-cyclodiphosphate synthase [Bacillota bacterium]